MSVIIPSAPVIRGYDFYDDDGGDWEPAPRSYSVAIAFVSGAMIVAIALVAFFASRLP